ncbi:hypothetical protein, partial [Burkholderia sp. BCC0398]|uniref:hypothetical protein n=1 Tax=Burkholderia sp. BCC0398 TaxID=2676297 RepID=UPI001ABA9178
DVREELGRRSARASGLIASVMGFVKQGQGHTFQHNTIHQNNSKHSTIHKNHFQIRHPHSTPD